MANAKHEEIISRYLDQYNQIAKEAGADPQVAEIAKELHLQQLTRWLEETEKDRAEAQANEPRLPDAKWKAIMLDFYNVVRERHDPDIWDYWGDKFEEYKGNRERIAALITQIYTELQLHDPENTPIKEKTSKIGECAGESYQETLQTIERILLKEGINPAEYQDTGEGAIAAETILEEVLRKAEEYLKSAPKTLPKTPETRYIAKTIRLATSPNIYEELCDYYDRRLYKLTEVAQRIPLWIASSFAPPIRTGYGNTNSSINVLLIGETGTGKTTIKRTVEGTAPRYITADVFTTPSFTGTAYRIGKTWDIKEGYIPQANGGILAIPEIDKILKDPKLEGAIRESVEKMTLLVTKAGVDRIFEAKYGLLIDSNFSGEDYFKEGETIYNQMGRTRRLLSRIDDPIPFAYIRMREIEGLVNFEREFLLSDENEQETANVKRVYEKIRNRLKEINCVGVQIPKTFRDRIAQKICELIKAYNDIELIRGREFTTAAKFIYASTVLHAYNRKIKEIPTQDKTITRQTALVAEKKDLDIALEILEIVIRNRSHILREGRRQEIFRDYEDMVMDLLAESGLQATREEITRRLREHKVSQRTAYRILEKMIQSGKLVATKTGSGKPGNQPTLLTVATNVNKSLEPPITQKKAGEASDGFVAKKGDE